MSKTHQWIEPKIHSNYGELRQTILAKANIPGGLTQDQADQVHRFWRRIGKQAQAGRLK